MTIENIYNQIIFSKYLSIIGIELEEKNFSDWFLGLNAKTKKLTVINNSKIFELKNDVPYFLFKIY